MTFESPARLVLGLITGIAFGVLLQKGRVAKHEVITGQLVLRYFTVLKITVTAVAVGAAGFWVLAAHGVTQVDVKPAEMGGVLLGAVLFGVGLAVLGYCPGTTVAAVGEGRRDAIAGLFGMLAGALAYVFAFPAIDPVRGAIADYGKVTLPDVTNVPRRHGPRGSRWSRSRSTSSRGAPRRGARPLTRGGPEMFFQRVKTPGIAHVAYVFGEGGEAAVVDPRRDVGEYLRVARGQNLTIKYVFETHRQEDFVLGATELARITGARIVNGAHALFGHGDVRLRDGEELSFAGLRLRALHTPGHTPESMCYALFIPDSPERAYGVFRGDALFIGETGRTDLPDPAKTSENARLLYDVVHAKLLPLGDQTLLFPAHGSGSSAHVGARRRSDDAHGAARLGAALRAESAEARSRVHRRRSAHDVRREDGPGLHERARDHRREPARRLELALHAAHVRDRGAHRPRAVRIGATRVTSEKSAARERLAGFATGLAFGALLQQGRLARHEVITGQLRMRDPRVARTMGTAVPVSALGVHALERAGVSTKEVKPTKPGAVLAGAGVFGVGLATLGYCPGTSIAAAGEGHRDALAGVAGMLGGAAVFVALRPKLEAALEAEGDRGPITLPSVTGTPASPWVAAIAGSALASLARARLSPRSPSASPRTTAPSPASSRSRR